MLKKCRKCDTEKELSEFNNSSSAKDGKQTKCRECEHQYRKDHIERYLQKGKEYRENNKEAHGEIELDHIIPCCAFNLSRPEDQRKCFRYTNTQPLWMSDNRKKLESDLKMKKLMRVDTISKDNYDELETDR